jgi:glycosyltransferase involved in cell wall biosynthesis
MKKKIYVRGPVLSQSGYGEQSRFALRALRSREDIFDIYIQPIKWGQTGWIWKDDEFRQWMDHRITETQILLQQKQLQPDISLQITIPNEFEKLCPVNIGYTAGIETTKCSPIWLQKCNEMDKVLVVSTHAKNTIVDTIVQAKNNQTGETFPYRCETPIEVVWENTERQEPEEISNLKIDYDNNFLMVSQLGPRKNFENTICWFVEEFIDQEVGLVVKTNFKGNSIIDFTQVEKHLKSLLVRYDNRKCKVYLLHGDLTPGQMTGLYTNPKINALINISHGEGFGLPMFEAAREGVPIVACGWSGHLDFLNQNGKDYFQSVEYHLQPVQPQAVWEGVVEKDSMWAFADQGSFKMVLRKTLKNLDKVKKTAKELQGLIGENFGDENLFKGFCDHFYNEETVDINSWLEELEQEIQEFE